MSCITYYRIKARAEEKKLARLNEIAKVGFVHQHIGRINQLELIQREVWKNYEQEQSPLKKVVILEKIASVQPYLSAYYEATKMVMKEGNVIISSNDNFESANDVREELLALHDNFESRWIK